jgi:hypothetical protein
VRIWGVSQSRLFGLVGEQGASKSYTATMWAVHEFLYGRRNIVTNLALLVEGWVAVCQSEGLSTLDLSNRIKVLDEDEQFFFWRYRSPNHEIKATEKIVSGDGHEHRSLHLPTQHVDDPGTMYILDEADIILGASQWKQVGPECELYVRQVRKHHDQLVLISHVPKNIDRFVRDQCREWHHLENHGRNTFLRIKKPKVFWDRVYRDMDGKTMVVDEHWYSFKPEIGACFATEAGVGAAGHAALGGDKADVVRGINWKWVPVGACVLALLLCLGFWGCTAAVKRRVDQRARTFLGSKAPVVQKPVERGVATVLDGGGSGSVGRRSVAWIARVNTEYQFGLSDGTVLRNPRSTLDENELRLATGERLALRISKATRGTEVWNEGR